jgi:flagellar basal body-associated protein FliL
MAEEEVLGDDDAVQEEEGQDDGGGGGFMDFTGGLLSSFVIKVLLGAIGLVAVILLVVGVTYYTANSFLMGTQPSEQQVTQEQPGAIQREPYKTFDLENDFIITKTDPRTGRTRTLKLHLVLAYTQDNAGVQRELKNRRVQIRDLIYGVLGSMPVEELGYDDKQSVQDRLVSEINKILTSGNRIEDVYFSDFVFQ